MSTKGQVPCTRTAAIAHTVQVALLKVLDLNIDLQYEPWKCFTTMVLRKPGKPRYDLPKAYRLIVLRSGGLKVRLAQVDCVGEFKGKGSGRVFGNDQR